MTCVAVHEARRIGSVRGIFGVTGETVTHVKASMLPGQRHPGDIAVTGGALDALADMCRVIEVDEIRDPMHTLPAEGRSFLQALANRLKHRGARPDLRMTGHASMARGHSRES